jgi:hypothetical protein
MCPDHRREVLIAELRSIVTDASGAGSCITDLTVSHKALVTHCCAAIPSVTSRDTPALSVDTHRIGDLSSKLIVDNRLKSLAWRSVGQLQGAKSAKCDIASSVQVVGCDPRPLPPVRAEVTELRSGGPGLVSPRPQFAGGRENSMVHSPSAMLR